MSEMVENSYGTLSVMEDGEFAGWRYWQGDPFETRSGPFYHRREKAPYCLASTVRRAAPKATRVVREEPDDE